MTLKLLADAQIREFLVQGCNRVQPSLPASFHKSFYDEFDMIVPADHVEIPGKGKKNNPGNNILPLIPALGDPLEDPIVKGALVSLVGPNPMLEPHRPWTVLAFYYRQEAPLERGPTGVVPFLKRAR